jgi:LacI family transcriptional regulator
MAVSHLFNQGYQRIGHIAGPMDWWESQKRFAAWMDVLKTTGIAVDDHHWVEGNWSSASGVQAAQKLFDQYPDMDAIFAGNDQMALGVLQVARQKGLRVPEDFGVVGFDDIPESAFFCPPLTTIKQDQQEVGRLAVEEIIRIIEADRRDELYESRAIMLTPKLVLRESSMHLNEANRS